jgi:hypothetical protein
MTRVDVQAECRDTLKHTEVNNIQRRSEILKT